MLDINLCIEKRKKYAIKKLSDDSLLSEINKTETLKEIFFIVPEGFLFMPHNKQRREFESKYSISGVFDMGQPYVNTKVQMVLVHAVSHSVKSINVSIYNGIVYDKQINRHSNDTNGFIVTPTKYTDDFIKYVKQLEDWINKGQAPNCDLENICEYNVVPFEKVNTQKLYPKYYSKHALEVRELLQKEKTVKLSEVADVLIPKEYRDDEESVKRLCARNMQYPFNMNELQLGRPTSIILQKGDIVFPIQGEKEPYLFNEEIEEKIYVSPHFAVIKSRSILPEYLYFYLTSDTAICILDSISIGVLINRISIKDLANLPVVLPSMDEQKYRDDFEIISSGNIRKYEMFPKTEQKNVDDIEDIINVETAQKLKIHNEKLLRTFLKDDMIELNTCFKGKAYKATLILAGSILEAVLIDWLSEKHKTNYFKRDFMVLDLKTGKERRADLVDYIDKIEEIERPQWIQEASKAHEIRKKRNLVHAKLCLKSDNVNEDVCKQVIDYLKDVLKTRGL